VHIGLRSVRHRRLHSTTTPAHLQHASARAVWWVPPWPLPAGSATGDGPGHDWSLRGANVAGGGEGETHPGSLAGVASQPGWGDGGQGHNQAGLQPSLRRGTDYLEPGLGGGLAGNGP